MDSDPAVAIFGSEDFDLYDTLNVGVNASADEVKSAYRRLALKFHPDKHASASKEEQEAASTTFTQIGYAYAVLSDEDRRKRYDATGNTAESCLAPGESGSWDAYFKELWSGEVNASTIADFFKSYEGSDEEKQDLYAAYNESQGSIEHILSHCFSSNNLTAEERFTSLINAGIEAGDLKATKEWKKSQKDAKGRARRAAEAKSEANEAEEMAREMGVHDKLYRKKGAKSGGDDEDSLRALIQQNAARRAQDHLSAMEAKYTAIESNKKAKKRSKKSAPSDDEDDMSNGKRAKVSQPTDEEFEALQAKLFNKDGNSLLKPDTASKSKRKAK